ncbi:MAG TPA: TIGR03619 family F420-dependent LLM class oxidoreductase [Acidimicrobiales bacterium]|nr:TIGR03619 family F420-dependent LLM class oxidoreductase [Acidimicrobiales bacterium]
MFATDVSIGVVELAREVEARGLGSLWLPEHTHIPLTRRTPHPSGRPLPEEYKRSLDPLVALAAAATATTTLRLGTGILLAAQREPLVTAKAVASLDHVSGGRVALGVGFGWNEDEMNDHGVEYRTRRAVGREHVRAMQALWRDDEAAYAGEHVRFGPTWSWPKPAQRGPDGAPAVPVLLGGAAGPRLFESIAEYADGWIPIGGAGLTDALPRLQAAVASAGRDPRGMEVVPFASIPEHGKLDHYAALGVTETVFNLPSAPRERILPLLDRYAKLVAERA